MKNLFKQKTRFASRKNQAGYAGIFFLSCSSCRLSRSCLSCSSLSTSRLKDFIINFLSIRTRLFAYFVCSLWLFCLAVPIEARPLFQEPWGNDSTLKPYLEPVAEPEKSVGTKIANAIIDFHQQVISPVDGPRSHFRPTSSQYMRIAMRRYGFLKGFVMGCDRLLRENDEKWVYRTVEIDGITYKFDPALEDKYGPLW